MSKVDPNTGSFITDGHIDPKHNHITVAEHLRAMHNYEETYDENDDDLKDHCYNKNTRQIINIRKKYDQMRSDRERKKEQLLKDLQAISAGMKDLEEQERMEIARITEENLQKRIKENEDYLLEQFEPLFNQDLVQFGMAVATLLRLGVYPDYPTMIREEAKKIGAYIRDQVFKTIQISAKEVLRQHLFEMTDSDVIPTNTEMIQDLRDTYID